MYKQKKKFKIGYVETEALFPAAPGLVRAVRETIQALRAQGHECVPISFPSFEKANFEYFQIMTAEGRMRSFFKFVNKEPLIKEYKMIVFSATMPSLLRKIVRKIFNWTGNKRLASVLAKTEGLAAHELFQSSAEQQAYQEEYIQMMKENQLDA